MRHSQIDEFAHRSPFCSVDPRVKFAALIAFLIVAALATVDLAAVLVLAFSLSIAAASRIPAKHLAQLSTASLPFIAAIVLGAAIVGRYESAIYMSIRILASVLFAAVFVSTTPLLEQIRAMQWFRIPKVLTSMILFTYRFVFVFIDELERMSLARRARGYEGRTHILHRRTFDVIGHTIGMLFIRVNWRANRLYSSLMNRGFDGTAVTRRKLTLGGYDVAYAVLLVTIILSVEAAQLGVFTWPSL